MILVRLVALAALALALSACADDEPEPRVDPTPTVSTSTSPTPDPTSTGPVKPTLPPEAALNTKQGAVAFVRYYWQAVNFAQATGDISGLADLAGESCAACKGGVDWIEKVYRRGGKISGGSYTAKEFSATSLSAGDREVIRVDAVVSTTREIVTGAGDLDAEYPADSSPMRFLLSYSSGAWHVLRWEVTK
jgi:hypothetical protein